MFGVHSSVCNLLSMQKSIHLAMHSSFPSRFPGLQCGQKDVCCLDACIQAITNTRHVLAIRHTNIYSLNFYQIYQTTNYYYQMQIYSVHRKLCLQETPPPTIIALLVYSYTNIYITHKCVPPMEVVDRISNVLREQICSNTANVMQTSCKIVYQKKLYPMSFARNAMTFPKYLTTNILFEK